MFVDLHLHTNFSDGTYTPEELAGHAKRHGFSAIALTDHDSLEGCDRMAAACRERDIEFAPGSEITAEMEGHELHLLAYLVDTQNPALRTALSKFQKVRQQRVEEMVLRLNQHSIPLPAKTVFDLANCQAPGRPHVARALVQGGYCRTVDEAFARFLKRNRPAWVPKFRVSAAEAIKLVQEAGGVVVMAHPGLNGRDELIPGLVEAGLDGLECFHTKHSTATSEHYIMLAEKHGLLVTGGSDCHGMTKGKPLIGTIKLPYEHLETLKRVAAGRRQRPSAPDPTASDA